MRGLRAKWLMKWARDERSQEKDIADRELVQRGRRDSTLVHSPYSIRATYQKLKAAWLRKIRSSGSPKPLPERNRKEADTFKMRDDRPSAVIQKPLEWILGHCPPTVKQDPITGGEVVILHPMYARARHAANRGDGATVKRIAASFA